MTYCHLTTNLSLSQDKEESLIKSLSCAVETFTGKSQAYIMLGVDNSEMSFGRCTSEPFAFIEVGGVNVNIDPHRNPKTIKILARCVAKELEIPKDKIYVILTDYDRTCWGFNGDIL